MGLKNKDLILNLLEKDLSSHGVRLSTIEIYKQLYMQRTNVSKLLYELVAITTAAITAAENAS